MGPPSARTAGLARLPQAAFLVALGLVGLGMPPVAWAGRLKVVTTIRPLYAFTAQVAGRAASVENLLPPGVGPHDYAFRPSDATRLHGADVLVINGLGIESWLEGMLEAVRRPDLVVIDASASIEPLPLDSPGAGGARLHEGRLDPHVWLDPVRAIRQVENIRDGLAAVDPANAPLYEANAERAVGRLRALHAELAAATDRFGLRELVTFHSAFQYFARRYGLEVVAVIETAPGKEPTPRFLSHLHELIDRHDIRVIYTEPQFRARVAEVLARDLGLEVAELDPGVTGPLRPDLYEAFMRRNLKVLARYQGR